MSEQQQIVEDATFQIAVAMQYVDWLRSVMAALRDRLDGQEINRQYAGIAEMAIYNADGWHDELKEEREELEKRAEKAFTDMSAPRNSNLATQARRHPND